MGAPTFLARGIAALEPELKRLRSLHAPDDLADVYKTSVSAFSRQLDELRTALRRLRAGGDPVITIKTLQARLAPLESTSNGGWRALEIPACLSQ